MKARMTSCPTLGDLRAELRRWNAELLAIIEALPEKFVNRKSSYVRIGQTLIQLVPHAEGHYNQIREAIEAART